MWKRNMFVQSRQRFFKIVLRMRSYLMYHNGMFEITYTDKMWSTYTNRWKIQIKVFYVLPISKRMTQMHISLKSKLFGSYIMLEFCIVFYFSCILVPGGFGHRGTEGKLQAISWARKKKKPFLGKNVQREWSDFSFA